MGYIAIVAIVALYIGPKADENTHLVKLRGLITAIWEVQSF